MPATTRHVLFLVALATAPAAAQKPTLTPADYARWESIGATEISPNGEWFAHTITRVDGDDELRVRAVRGDSARSIPFGTRPTFSRDSRWLAYGIGAARAEQERNPALRMKLGLLDLRTGATVVVDDIADFAFSADGGFVAMRAFPPQNATTAGADVIIRDLASGMHTTLGNVAEFAWRDHGAVLATVIDAANRAGNGVRIYDARSGITRTLASDTSRYVGLQWRDSADDVAVLREIQDSAYAEETHAVLAWRNASAPQPRRYALEPLRRSDLPPEHRIVGVRELDWIADGSAIVLGLRPWTRTVAEGDSAEQPSNVEVWHSRDVDVVPEQKVRAGIEGSRSIVSVWHLERDRLVQLSRDVQEDVTIAEFGSRALVIDRRPYGRERMFGPEYRDLYIADLATGERVPVAQRVQFQYGVSPTGRYVLFVRDGHYWAFDTGTRRSTNITANVPTSFINVGDDHTVPEKPPFGTAGWTVGDRTVLLHDKYDMWEVSFDGAAAVNLTQGAADRVVHRRVWLHPDHRIVDTSQPVYVALYGDRTKKYGYGRTRGRTGAERLVFTDALATRLTRARDADVYFYKLEAFDDSPDIFVGSSALADARQVTNTNPFMAEYAWGRAQLIDVISSAGDSLQGALLYPANYDAGRMYPLVVFPYEITSNTIHNFHVPTEENPYNPTVLTQQGYFVLRPDVVFRARNPGVSAVDAIVPAVRAALRAASIDSTRVGLLGHSWGAYQAAFLITQTDVFRTAVAGAPLTNLISMYGSIFWNVGMPDAKIFETGQARMEVPFWEDLDTYIRNSPLFNIERMNAPLLVAFGDEDGAVDWNQGVELYNAARRARKQLVLLVYPGENHSLGRKANQIDLHRRILEWFGHYLKGQPAPGWIEGTKPSSSR